jgi:hypothetical protein
MPCVTLSSGKTVCFDNNNSYGIGGEVNPLMEGDPKTGTKATPPATPKNTPMVTGFTSEQLAGLATQIFSSDPNLMGGDIPAAIGNRRLTDNERVILRAAIQELNKAYQQGPIRPITPQRIDELRSTLTPLKPLEPASQFALGGETGGNFHQFGTPQKSNTSSSNFYRNNPTAPTINLDQFNKQQAKVAYNLANPAQALKASGLKPAPTTKPTNVLKANPTSTVNMPPINTRMARTDSTQVARPNAQTFQAKLDQQNNDPLGYAAAAKIAEGKPKDFLGRLVSDSFDYLNQNPELKDLATIASPLLAIGAIETIPAIAAETTLLEAPAALTEAFETANALYKGYQTIDKGINAGKNVASGNYAGAAGNVLDIGKSFIPAANLNVAKDLTIDAASGALEGYGNTGTLTGTARGAFDNTAGDRLAGIITGNKDTFGRNIIKQQLKSVEAGFKKGGKVKKQLITVKNKNKK